MDGCGWDERMDRLGGWADRLLSGWISRRGWKISNLGMIILHCTCWSPAGYVITASSFWCVSSMGVLGSGREVFRRVELKTCYNRGN